MNPKSALNIDPTEVLWRYLSFPKFVDFLENKALYFCRLDLLEDPFEGSVSIHDIEADTQRWFEMSLESGTPAGLYRQFEYETDFDPRREIYVNCWHMSPVENVAMWSLYSDLKNGVAIKTNAECLRLHLPDDAKLGKVQYRDYEKERVSDISPVYSKRIEFEHEKEARAAIFRKSLPSEELPSGITIPIGLEQFILEVRLSPKIEGWMANLIKNICVTYGVTGEIIKSSLSTQPRFNWYIETN